MNDEMKTKNPNDLIKFIPNLQNFMKVYGQSFEGNDQKAFDTFRMFESDEKLRRVRGELMAIKNGKVDPRVMDNIIGKSRTVRFKSYERWAGVALQWLTKKG